MVVSTPNPSANETASPKTNNEEVTAPASSKDGSNTNREIHARNNAGNQKIIGRIKGPPACFASLQKEAITAEELSRYLLPPSVLQNADNLKSPSSIENLSKLNEKMLEMTNSRQGESRQGRSHQKWETDLETNQRIRLVTGCVPILDDGKIMFVSASRKPEWILPKGGWELDESMEESAIRETFEEAGILGTLGPPLSAIQYETRKSKKRRLEIKAMEQGISNTSNPSDGASKDGSSVPGMIVSELNGTESESVLSETEVEKIRCSNPTNPADDISSAASAASDSGTYSLVRMTLFPLYVSAIKDVWPESGRLRKCLPIDEGIKMFHSREEFRSILLEVKSKKLHIIPTK